MSSLETQMCNVNVNRFYAWLTFYKLLKENLAKHAFLILSQNKKPGQITAL